MSLVCWDLSQGFLQAYIALPNGALVLRTLAIVYLYHILCSDYCTVVLCISSVLFSDLIPLNKCCFNMINLWNCNCEFKYFSYILVILWLAKIKKPLSLYLALYLLYVFKMQSKKSRQCAPNGVNKHCLISLFLIYCPGVVCLLLKILRHEKAEFEHVKTADRNEGYFSSSSQIQYLVFSELP